MAGEATLENRIFNLPCGGSFESLALEVFCYQYNSNEIYQNFCKALGRSPASVKTIDRIPFLPVEFFRTQRVVSFKGLEMLAFTSSGTTGMVPSKHFVYDISVYERSLIRCFEMFYGDIRDYCVLALLPSYLERSGSSLVYMANKLIEKSGHPDSGFYLHDFDRLSLTIRNLGSGAARILLLGVSFALLDFAGKHPLPLRNAVVMETGGMKGRRREMVREELHQALCNAFHQKVIHSEYGMTELLSQAYSTGGGLFNCPPWMRVLICDSSDPFEIIGEDRTGAINIIDLANLHSCSFIATKDLGVLRKGGSFEVLGRFDHSDMRGCNLMLVNS